MTYGITTAGFVAKTLSTIQTETRNTLISILGTSVNLLPESVFGQLIDIYSERESLLWELGEAIYNSQYITATGASLDLVAGTVGKRRRAATPSVIADFQMTFSGVATVPAGATFSDPNDDTKVFEIIEGFTTTGSGIRTVTVSSTTPGAISANAGTITQIDSPIINLTSVTNTSAAIAGEEQETDAELRARLQNLPVISISNTVDAIENAIRQLNEVSEEITAVKIEAVRVIENNTDTTDSDGRPPHSFETVVYQTGGSTDRDEEILNVLATSKPQGIQLATTTGTSKTGTVTLTGGNTRSITFSRPATVDIYVDVDITADSNYPSDGDTQVQTAIETYINSLTVADDVIVYGSSSISTAINSIAGVIDYDLYVGTSSGTAPGATANIPITSAQIARAKTITVGS
jgi:uncharacterized phage protein gp47/JayE